MVREFPKNYGHPLCGRFDRLCPSRTSAGSGPHAPCYGDSTGAFTVQMLRSEIARADCSGYADCAEANTRHSIGAAHLNITANCRRVRPTSRQGITSRVCHSLGANPAIQPGRSRLRGLVIGPRQRYHGGPHGISAEPTGRLSEKPGRYRRRRPCHTSQCRRTKSGVVPTDRPGSGRTRHKNPAPRPRAKTAPHPHRPRGDQILQH